MERKTIIGIALCFLFYLAYSTYLQKKYPNLNKTGSTVVETDTSASQGSASSDAQKTEVTDTSLSEDSSDYEALTNDQLVFETDKLIARFDQESSAFSSIQLKNHFQTAAKDSDPYDTVGDRLSFRALAGSQVDADALREGFQAERKPEGLAFSRVSGPWRLSQEVIFTELDSYKVEFEFSWTNISAHPADLNATVMLSDAFRKVESTGGFLPGMPLARPAVIVDGDEEVERWDGEESCGEDVDPMVVENVDIGFLGFDLHYFLNALIPHSPSWAVRGKKLQSMNEGRCRMAVLATQPQGMVEPGATVTAKFSGWLGPKDLHEMATTDENLKRSLDLGWFAVISYPLLEGIRWLYKLLGNYGLAIIFLTVVLKILFYPLTKQAAVSMHKMKKLQPEMNSLKEKYKSDPRRQQQELMKFMSRNKVNPMKGCLPILPQIPVFFAFYRVLSTSIELRHAPFYGWIQDLSVADPYYVTPVIMGVCMFLQQKLTPAAPGMDKTQQRIMLMMPVLFSVMMLTLPAGMVLYMLANTLVSIAQQQWLNKKLEN